MDNSFLYSKKILLVDDEPDLLKMAADILKDAGFETVLTAPGAKEAVAAAKQEKPDLIILDVMLPDGDGFSLMKQLRTFTDVPVIFLTAKDEAADKLAGLGLGADDYISKPFMPQELLLRKVCSSFSSGLPSSRRRKKITSAKMNQVHWSKVESACPRGLSAGRKAMPPSRRSQTGKSGRPGPACGSYAVCRPARR